MTSIVEGRKTITPDQDLVVFLIGARVNKWWLLPLSLPILMRMRAMQRELLRDKNSGLIALRSLGTVDVQYWRSKEDLLRYAGDKERAHKPTIARFFQKVFKNAAIGIWHETFLVRRGDYESVYVNMPRLGLGEFLPLVDATFARATARGRLEFGEKLRRDSTPQLESKLPRETSPRRERSTAQVVG